jgi:hypothetical protein
MNNPHSILRDIINPPADGGAGGGGGGNPPPGGHYDFRPTLPEDIRNDPVWDPIKVKDANEFQATLAKGYVHAQKTIGTARLPVPQKDWKTEDWAKFNKAIGVPETPDGYQMPKLELAKGLELIPESLAKYKKLFHEMGLRPEQSSKLMEFYLTDINTDFTTREQAKVTAQTEGMNVLKQEFGDKVNVKIDLARAVLKKHGSEGLLKAMTDTGLTNNPDMVKFLAVIGEGMMEDGAKGDGTGLPVGERTVATQEIARLRADGEFQKRLNDRSNPGHADAVEKWLNLHKVAAGPQT